MRSPTTETTERLDLVRRGGAAQDRLMSKMPVLAQKYGVPGAQLAIHRREHTATVEYGESAHASADTVVRETAFPIGSITKCFTATAAMVLVADGDLDLDEPIGTYLHGLDDGCGRITLRQLLSHTSGLGTGPMPGTVSIVSPSRYVAEYCRDRNLLLAPGTAFSYSNAGFIVVGRLIEVVTGMSFWEAIETIVLGPLGIAPAFVNDLRPHRPVRPVATGHSVNLERGRVRPVEQALATSEAPAGSLLISATDLVALARLHTGVPVSRLLPPDYAELMRVPIPFADPFGLASGWGLGFAAFQCADGVWYGHDGNANGTCCYLRFQPSSDLIVAFTSNSGTGAEVWRELLDELQSAGFPVEHPPARPAQPIPFASPAECAGTYYNDDVAYVVHADETGQLHLAVDGGATSPLNCLGDLTFTLYMPTFGHQAFGRFLRNRADGQIDSIQIAGRLALRRSLAADRDGRDGSPREVSHP